MLAGSVTDGAGCASRSGLLGERQDSERGSVRGEPPQLLYHFSTVRVFGDVGVQLLCFVIQGGLQIIRMVADSRRLRLSGDSCV